MGHLYHGYVSHNQRVNPSKNWANSHPRPRHRWHLRAESPVRPSSRRSGPGSDGLEQTRKWTGTPPRLGETTRFKQQQMDVGQNGRPRGPQMWMSSLVLTIHNFGVPNFDPYPNQQVDELWWNQEKTLPLFTAWRAWIFQISGLFYWVCYLDTLRDSDRPTWWAYYIHTFI